MRVPADALLGGEGQAFAIAQTRLGGGRIHHAMRTIGLAQKALDMMCERALSRETQGSLLADKQFVQGYIADSYAQLVQFRLFVLYTAWEIDKYNDYQQVRKDIATAKVVMPTVLHDIAWRAMQVHGALGVDATRCRSSGMIHGAARHGPGRRPDRGAQGHRRPAGAARLQGRATTCGRPSGSRRSSRRPRRSSPSTSSTKWGTCDRLRPARRRGWTTSGLAGQGRAARAPLHLRRLARTRSTRSAAATCTARMRIPPPTAPADRDDGHPARVADHRGARRHRRAAHRRRSRVCDDPSVLGRTFYLMGFVDGWSPMDTSDGWPAPFDTDLEARRGPRATSSSRASRCSSKVDWQAKGLQDLGRPDGFHERQVDRWTAFLERIKGRELPGFDEASAWLRAHKPIDYIPGLMHGDYQFANVMYQRRRAGPAGRDRRLGDGHRRRPEARPRLGRAELARRHDGAGGARRRATST